MYTHSKAYVSKFSSGTILALLALSGFLFLVQVAVPVFAANANNGIVTSNVNVFKSSGSTSVTFTFSNPASNQFSENQFLVAFGSSGFVASACSATGFGGTASFTYAAGSVLDTGQLLPPGGTGSYTCTIASPALVSTTSAPDTYTFTYKTSDTSTTALVTAGTATVYVTGATAFTVVTVPASTATLTAGASVTATFTAVGTLGIAGIPVTFSWVAPATYDASGLATLTASTVTDGSGNAVANIFPDPVIAEQGSAAVCGTAATDRACVAAEAGGNTGITGQTSPIIVTIAGPASALSISVGGVSPPTKIMKAALALIPAASIIVTSTDVYGNPAAVSATLSTTVTLTAVNLVGSRAGFSSGAYGASYPYVPTGATAPVQTSSATIAATHTTGTAALGYIYDVDYLTESYIVASAASLTSGSSSHIITDTLSSTAGTITPPGATSVTAGKTATITFLLPTVQAGVPVYFKLASSSAGYDGTFVGGGSQVVETTDNTGTATATLTVDTVAASFTQVTTLYAANPALNVTVAEPLTGVITTIAGTPSKLTLAISYDSSIPFASDATITNEAVNGTKLYINAIITDAYGNIASNPGPGQIQVSLSTSPATTLSSTSVVIPQGQSETDCVGTGCSGAVFWDMPKTIGTTVILTASGADLTSATFTVKTVSATPLLTITSPTPVSGVIYSNTPAVVFSGFANVSAGFATTGPKAVTMATIGYKVGTAAGGGHKITLAGSNPTWSFAATMSAGLNTLSVNATDSNGDTVFSSVSQVLVDTTAPKVTYTTANNAQLTGGAPVVASVVVAEGDLNASSVSAWVNGTAIASSNIAITGTNSLGVSVNYTISIKNLPTGTDNVVLSASSLAGLTASASITVKVIVPFAVSVAINSATSGTLGSYSGISVSATNLWSTSQSLVIFAVYKNSAGQTVAVATGGLTLASGATGTAFAPLAGALPSGTYSVSVFVITTTNSPVSNPTTISVSA